MNPLTNMKNIKKLGEQELETNYKSSWHDQYKDSAWIFVGGLPFDLTEGDIITVFSQYGEVVNLNLIREKDTGKSKGFCFLCYEDQRSTNLAVDNFNGIKLIGRIIRVDHVSNYKVPKDGKKTDEITKQLRSEGCAPKPQPPPTMKAVQPKPQDLRETLSDQVSSDIKLPMRLPIYIVKDETSSVITTATEADDDKANIIVKKEKKHKKEKRKHKKKKSHKKRKETSDSSDSDSTDEDDRQRKDKKRKY